jgi:hypothetical protein
MSKTKMMAAKELIQEKRYDEARVILRSVDHPTAIEWLQKLDKIDPPNALQKIFRAVLPKSHTPSKSTEYLAKHMVATPVQPTKKEVVPVMVAPPITAPEVENEIEDEGSDENLITPNHQRHNGYPKAIAGEFDGIQFRSQLEIRFAAELKKRDIEYEYEPARIGKGNYMIDFHLPEYGIWVEVKGKMDARDEFLLQECADYLQESRMDSLYVYNSDRKMHLVHHDKLEYLWPGKFWEMLEAKQSHK